MSIVSMFGEMWARNTQNIEDIPGSKEGGQGVYILYDGSMPVYVGKGNIRQRIRKARQSERRSEHWDHFSWYAVPNPDFTHDIEALLLRMLPFYLRTLNLQRGKFKNAKRHRMKNKMAEPIKRSKLPPRKETSK